MTNKLEMLKLMICTFFLLSQCSFIQGTGYESPEVDIIWDELIKDFNPEELNIKRNDFPCDFLFGVSTAAVQIEGAVKQDGKGESIWDEFVEESPEKIMDGSNMSVALDSYNRYLDDVKALEDLKVNSYRFSIPWTRILPSGSLSGGVNRKAIDHYNKLIDQLIENGIKPFVTLIHFDLPQLLQEKYGGFLSRSIIDDFKDFSEICFKEFGDRVKNWITINEPLIVSQMGYDLGVAAPGRCSSPYIAGQCPSGNSTTEPYIVTHHLLLAHATVYRLYKQKFQKQQGGEVGISLVGKYFEPYSDVPEDHEAALRLLDFQVGWFMEPLVFGDYPETMKDLVKERLPSFTSDEKKLMKNSFDFVGLNYYTSRYAKNASYPMPPRYTTDALATEETERDGVLIGPKAEGSGFIYIYPEGLNKLLLFMKRKYQSPVIYITENGISEMNKPDVQLKDALNDPQRIINTLRHLYNIRQAMRTGVNVRGYFIWTLFDDFEFGEGYVPRYGLYYVDYNDNLKRIPKSSAKWLPAFLDGGDRNLI